MHALPSSLVTLALVLATSPPLAAQSNESLETAQQGAPDGVQILLPRGAIGAVFDPQWVSANDAEIPDEAWVLGVVIEGEAHAYSLNLLNHHEVVNDRFGDLPVAAVW